MLKPISLAGAAVLALTFANPALAQGHGPGGGQGHEKGRGGPPAHAGGPERNRGPERGPDRGPMPKAGPAERGGPDRAERARTPDRDERRVEWRAEGPGRDGPRAAPHRDDTERYLRREWDRVVIQGCPPGLAKRGNGCVPPGLERVERQVVYVTPRWNVWDRGDDYRYRYNDGYLYRTNTSGGILGYLPLLGGALGLGSAWPQEYSYEPVPAYYGDYYGLNNGYDYRYADGVVYGVDRNNGSIGQIAALLTGQQWNVGSRMPSGYDVYNVPYAYRSQYVDTPDRWYRYDDGRVYQVDPTTQLVQAVIQLLT